MSAESPPDQSRILQVGMRIAVVVAVVALILVARQSGWFALLSLETLQSRHGELQAAIDSDPWTWIGGYFALYVLATALSFPGATILTLAGAALFGFWKGLVIVSFASTLGATLAFLSARWLLRDLLRKLWPERVAALDAGIRRDGTFYVLSLRLAPVLPFFVVNLGLGLTAVRVPTYWIASQIGMIPGTVVYMNAGTHLSEIRNLSDLFSPAILLSLLLLALLPWAARMTLGFWKRRRLYARWTRPRAFDVDIAVIGAGSGGLVTAHIGANAGAKVALIEKHRMGGDCLNTGCVPSKALIHRARLLAGATRARQFLSEAAANHVDYPRLRSEILGAVASVAPHDSAERYRAMGVDVASGIATVRTPWEIDVEHEDGSRRTLRARQIVVATGGRPRIPDTPGMEHARIVTSDTIWDLESLPARLVVVGGGPIGCELAQAFARLGSRVVVVDRNARLLPREDPMAGELVAAALRRDGAQILESSRIVRFDRSGDSTLAVVETSSGMRTLECDVVLVALGRIPNATGFGLEELGVTLDAAGRIAVDDAQRTSIPNILAVGDVSSQRQFTHLAGHQAFTAAANALATPFHTFRTDMSAFPRVTFTSPEIAVVGLTETEARESGITYETTWYPFDDLDRALAEGETGGGIRILTRTGTDRILGVTIIGGPAGEMLAEFTLAMKHRLGLRKILGTVHPYPSWSDANKLAAGRWLQARKPVGLVRLASLWFAWRRGDPASRTFSRSRRR